MNVKAIVKERPWILSVVVALLVLGYLATGNFGQTPPDEAQIASDASAAASVTRVQVDRQEARPIQRFIRVYGRTAPAREVEINAETDGRVESIGARRGEQVAAGKTLVRLDLRDRKARLEQAKASVREHETSYRGQLKLKQEGYVSETQIAETLAKLELARADQVRAELDLKNMNITAPFPGVILERDVEVGDFLREGDPVATFVDNTTIIVTGSIAEQDARWVSRGTQGTAALVTGQEIKGKVRYMAPVADLATRTFTVEMEVPNPTGSLPAGVTAELRLPAGQVMAQKVSPAALDLDTEGNLGLKTVDADGRVRFFPVEIARSEPSGVWVTGLPEVADIIVVGQGYVSDGQRVEAVLSEPDTALAAEKTTERLR